MGRDILIEDMKKRILRILYLVLMILSGILLALISALASSINVSAVSGLGSRFNQEVGVAAFFQATTPTPVTDTVSRAGSTDGIMVMGVVIVIIVLLPILLRRSMWTK
jgi:hypothetical protein